MTNPQTRPGLPPEDELAGDLMRTIGRLHHLASIGEATQAMLQENASLKHRVSALHVDVQAGRDALDAANASADREIAGLHQQLEDSSREQAALHEELAAANRRADEAYRAGQAEAQRAFDEQLPAERAKADREGRMAVITALNWANGGPGTGDPALRELIVAGLIDNGSESGWPVAQVGRQS